ncbi:MAG: alkaline phosphatase D family protein, partial [bacterium]
GAQNAVRGYKAMFPHYPLPNSGNGLWHKFTYGNADFFILDTRTQRDPNINGFRQAGEDSLFFEPNSSHLLLQGNPNIEGELQMDWLIRELQASTATWKFIGTSVQFNPAFTRAVIEYALLLGRNRTPFPVSTTSIANSAADSWGGFPHSMARLVKAVHEAQVENIIMMSGDSHTAAIDDGANSLFPEIMAGGLDRTNSRQIALAEFFGIFAWNQGGQTNTRDNFNSHYGQITVFGDDSVRMNLVDEFGELITTYTQKAGHLVSPVALAIAPQWLNLGDVTIGDSVVQEIVFVNTGADEIVVSDLMTSDPQFQPSIRQLALQSADTAQTVNLVFKPRQVGNFSATLTVESNDPQSPFVISLTGNGKMATGVADTPDEIPQVFGLAQNYPNPFNAATRISFDLAQTSDVSLSIFNIFGQRVRQFHFKGQKAGRYSITWDGRDAQKRPLASGMYIYRLEVFDVRTNASFGQSKKMLMMK